MSIFSSIPSIEEAVPVAIGDKEALMAALHKIVERGDVLKLTISAAESVIRYERTASTEEAEMQANMTWHDVVRARPMEEYAPTQEETSYQQLFEMFEILGDAGFVPIAVLIGRPIHELRTWLNLMSRKAKSLYGVPIVTDPSIPEDSLILCGSDRYVMAPEAIRYSVKVSL